jgi:hypothetical protein
MYIETVPNRNSPPAILLREGWREGNKTGQRRGLRITTITTLPPASYASHGLPHEGNCRLRTVQPPRPAADRRSIRRAISVLQPRHRLFPATVLPEALPQRLTAGQQTEVSVRKRKQRKECERRLAVWAASTTDPDPAVMLVVRLLAATAVANNRIALTNRTMA